MAGKREIQRECDRLNRARNVKTVSRLNVRAFWESAGGSFIISGGSESLRTEVLSSKLLLEMERGTAPIVVLSASSFLESEMIRYVEEGIGGDGTLRVSSQHYRNYHFFYGWSADDISRFLLQAASMLRYGNAELPIYIHAFIDILERCYPPGLSSISALAAHSDEQIAQIGQRCGVQGTSIEQISHFADAGVIFRLLLRQISETFSPLTTVECNTKYNMTNISPNLGGVFLIDMRTHMPQLLHEYFAEEIQLALNRLPGLSVVVSDLMMPDEDPLKRMLRETQMWNGVIGVSTQNSTISLGPNEGNFQTRMILLDSGYSDGDLENELRPLGTYTHYEPMLSGGRPGKLFNIMTDTRWSLGQEPGRLRVRPIDVVGYEAVLYSGGQIQLARSLF